MILKIGDIDVSKFILMIRYKKPVPLGEEIKTVINPITFNVTVDSSVYSVHLSGDIPTPVLYADGDDVMCSEISLVFEEM